MLVIVSNVLADKLNEALDHALVECPGAECERASLYQRLLSYYNEHGVIPDFSVRKRCGEEEAK